MFVKICGITRPEDAAVAVAYGASAIGFIFWAQSRRYVDPEQARVIVRTLPPFVTPVGVFVNEPADAINAVAARVGLGAVQLHGDETPALLAALVSPVVKAVGCIDADTATHWPSRVRLLVDADVDAAAAIAQSKIDGLTTDLAAKAAQAQVDVYSTPGTFTWTKPANAKFVDVHLISGGGGGALSDQSSNWGSGGDGGSGIVVVRYTV